MIDEKQCVGCRNNFYNGSDKKCWSRKTGKMVWRIRIGNFENPPYLNKEKFRAADCWHAESCGDHLVDPEKLTKEGYWR